MLDEYTIATLTKFWTLTPKNREKSKFQKSLHDVLVSPQNLSQNKISASTDLHLTRSITFYVKIDHFSTKSIFLCIWRYPLCVADHKKRYLSKI